MTAKFENQQILSSTAVAVVLGAECKSFRDWPQGQLPAPLLGYEEFRTETKFDSLRNIRAGKSTKKAEQALAAVYGPHPVIRTFWGMVGGHTGKCFKKGAGMYHAIEIYTAACWQLETPEIMDQFGYGEEFTPYVDAALDLVKYDVDQFNNEAKDQIIEVFPGVGYGLLEFECRFKKTADRGEEKAAFATLMQFAEKLFQSGRLDEIVAQSCNKAVLKRAMVAALWSRDMSAELEALRNISGPKAKVCAFADLPALSSASVAAAIMALGVNEEEWPRASYPEEVIGIHRRRVEQAVRLDPSKTSEGETARIMKEALSDMLMPRAVLRTSAGMIRLSRYSVEGLGMERGVYQLSIFLSTKWKRGKDSAKWSERALILLADRSAHLLEQSLDYEVELGDRDDYGMLDVSSDFDLAAGPEAEEECKQALVDYVFAIFATGLIDRVLVDAIGDKPIVVLEDREPA
jgi:hypothetical protein